MAKSQDLPSIVPMLFLRFKDEFAEIDWAKPLSQAFEVAQLLDAIKSEAGAKGRAVFIQVALVPQEWFYGPAEPSSADTTPEGEIHDHTDLPELSG